MVKSQNRPAPDLTDVDWARLAAFIDGEGHIRIASSKARNTTKRKDRMHVEVSVHNNDPRLILWLRQRFGGCTAKDEYSGIRKHHAAFRWYATCGVAHEILTKCLPYFIIKRDQAEIAIAFRNLTVKKWGRGGIPLGLLGLQYSMKQELQDSRTLHFETLVH